MDIVSGLRIRSEAAIFLGNFNIPGFDNELPALRHGIPGVQAKVHKDLVDLGRVRQRDVQISSRLNRDRDVFSDHSPKQTCALQDVHVQVDSFRLQKLPPCERKKLGCESPQPCRLVR